MGDQYNLSGDFRGAILNIQSELTHTEQTVNNIATEDVGVRTELSQLIDQLKALLEKVPEPRLQEAEAVALTAKDLVDQATSARPNQTLLQIKGEGLKRAAETLADILPTVLSIATRIVTDVMKLA